MSSYPEKEPTTKEEYLEQMMKDPVEEAYNRYKETQNVAESPKPAPVKVEKPKYAVPVPVTAEDIAAGLPAPAGPAVVSNNTVDNISLQSIIYKNIYARKSLSVHHVQRRLNELGYSEAYLDKDGYYGDNTKDAIARFQGDNNMLGAGMMDSATLNLLFTNDPNVIITP